MDRPVTLITGASRGIGRFLAEYYLGLGHCVVGCSRGDSDLVDAGYSHASLDVSDEEKARVFFSSIRKVHGGLDHLINNAGVASMNHSLLTPIPSLGKIINTNLVGTFLFSCEAAKIMKRRRFGRIVNFTTIAVPLRLEGESAYVASKAGVEALTSVMSKEFATFGITVNAVGPGPVATDLIRSVPKDKIDALVGQLAIGRLTEFEDIANVVDFFLRPESALVTGQTLYLGGV